MPEQGVITPAFHHSFPGSVCITAEDDTRVVHIHGQHSKIESRITRKAVNLQKLKYFLQADYRFLGPEPF